jgi:hypothetical protein
MEAIRLNDHVISIVPMGIVTHEKKRVFTISSELSSNEIEMMFSNVERIEYLSESGEVLATYLDGVGIKTITKDLENSTYIIEVSTDPIERKMAQMQAEIDALKASQN